MLSSFQSAAFLNDSAMGDQSKVRPRRHPAFSAADLIRSGGTFALLLVFVVGPAAAADWKASSTLSQRFEFDDNISVSADSAGNVLASLTGLSTLIEALAPTHRFTLGQSFDLYKYTGPGKDDVEDRFTYENVFARFTKDTKATTYEIGANIRRDPTESTEFLEETGRTAERDVDRLSARADGSVTHQVNTRNSVVYDLSAEVVDYSGDSDDFTPFVRADTNLSWIHTINGRTSVSANGGLGYSQFDDEVNTTNYTFLTTIGVDHRLSKRLSATLDIGIRGALIREDATLLLPSEEECGIGPTANFSIDYRGKRTAISLTGTQSLEPSSDGELESRTSVGFRIGHDINSASAVSFDVTVSRFESASDTGTTDTQTLTVGPTYSRRINRYWGADFGYLFRYRDDSVETAKSNKLFFSLSRDINWLP